MRWSALVTLLLALPVLAEAPEDPGVVIEEVVAVVGERVFTRSDLELEARVILVQNGGIEAAFGAVDAATTASVLDYVIHQSLILAEAERLEVFPVSPEERERALAAFSRRLGPPEVFERFLAVHEVGAERVAAVLERDVRVERYLDTRVRLSVRVTDADVTGFLAENGDALDGTDDPEVRLAVRNALVKQRFEEAVRELVADLRERRVVRVLVPPPAFPPRTPGAIATVPTPMLSDPRHAPTSDP